MNKRQLKKMVKDCVYFEDGITYLSDEHFHDYMNSISDLLKENKQLKEKLDFYNGLELDKTIDKTRLKYNKLQQENELLKAVVKVCIDEFDLKPTSYITDLLKEKGDVDVN